MQSLKFGIMAAALVCALSATAQAANCARITALGETLTHGAAVLFSTNALKNTLAAQGRVGKVRVHTTCNTASVMTACYSTQVACKGATPKTWLGAWLCF